ncbi:MAG: hypothetical protein KGL56_05060 [Alphaproteobacteria bacterium]|nr:hypothetical protein [Alphaproteobacteria bacterium]
MTIIILGSSALAQKNAGAMSAPTQASPQPNSSFPADPAPVPNCIAMRQQISSAMDAESSSFNATAARQEAAKDDQACATGDAQTAHSYYQKALDLLASDK